MRRRTKQIGGLSMRGPRLAGSVRPSSGSSCAGACIRCRPGPRRASTPNGISTGCSRDPSTGRFTIFTSGPMVRISNSRISRRCSRRSSGTRTNGRTCLPTPARNTSFSPPSTTRVTRCGPAGRRNGPMARTTTPSRSAPEGISWAIWRRPSAERALSWDSTIHSTSGIIHCGKATSNGLSRSICFPNSKTSSRDTGRTSSGPTGNGSCPLTSGGAPNCWPGCSTRRRMRAIWSSMTVGAKARVTSTADSIPPSTVPAWMTMPTPGKRTEGWDIPTATTAPRICRTTDPLRS